MRPLLILLALSFLSYSASAGEVVKRDVRYKKDGPVISQYVLQTNGSRGVTCYSRSRSRRYDYGYLPVSYYGGHHCYSAGTFRSYYPAYRTTRVTFIHRPAAIHRPVHHHRVHSHRFHHAPIVIKRW